jgi:predicted AAA+ superfamily ATPase
MYKSRALSKKIQQLADHFPAVVISGARQVGKSTLIQHIFPGHDIVVFDPSKDVGNARQDPDLFLDNHRPPLVLDEIQYAPELVSALKRRIDGNRIPGGYILTGSQQWSVLKTISDSLAGRCVFVDLEGFSLSEIDEVLPATCWLSRWLADSEAFLQAGCVCRTPGRTLYEQLWRGWLPEADRLPLEMLPDFHAAYFRTYIERDVRLLADVDDWQQFGRFVQFAAAVNGQEINHSQLGRDIGVTPQTARRWLALLRATFQWYEVSAYSGNAIKRISGKAKGYFADSGMACHLQQISSPKALGGHPQVGALFESAVMAEIRKMAALESVPPVVYHWRTHGGAEIDILLERDGCFYPIEVKLTTRPSRKDTAGFKSFRVTYPYLKTAPGLVITPGLDDAENSFRKISEEDYALSWNAV